jgi:hypothetical protein
MLSFLFVLWLDALNLPHYDIRIAVEIEVHTHSLDVIVQPPTRPMTTL